MILRATVTWILLAAIGVLNGILRGTTYGLPRERTAHQISTVTCVAGLFAGAYLSLRNSIADVRDRTLLGIGAGWSLATIAFEFGFGHFVAGEPWSKLLAAYDVRKGQTWSAVPISILMLPLLVKRIVVRDRPTPKS
ncbi:MAG: hypothetical protein R3A46_12300 [Thermomicrobiales bacterium]